MSASANLLVRIAADITGFDRATQRALSRIKGLASDLESIGTRLSIGVTLPIAGFATAALKATGDIEALKLGLNSITRSAAETERQFTALREVAKLPGLGLEEAVRGATNLQALGFSFEKSRSILLSFGNALASVGRGRDDLEEVIRQLGQLGARGQVTADNLRPIIERVPQVASIIKREFGPDAIGAPAETFKKLGVSSQEFIDVITRELGKIPPVTGGIKNTFENLSDTIKQALSDVGASLVPATSRIVNEFVVPVIEKIGELGRSFTRLPESVQTAVISMTAVAATAPLVLAGLGSIIRITIDTASAFTKLGGAIATSNIAVSISNITYALTSGGGLVAALTTGEARLLAFGKAAATAIPFAALAAGIYLVLDRLNDFGNKTDTTKEAVNRLTKDMIVFNDVGGKTGFAMRQLSESVKSIPATLEAYIASTIKGTKAIDDQRKAIDEIKKKLIEQREQQRLTKIAMEELGIATEKTTEKLKRIPFEEVNSKTRVQAATAKILADAYNDVVKAVAKFEAQGGQQTIFSERIPAQVQSITDSLKDLEAQSSSTIVIQERLRDAVASVPAAMFDYAKAMDAVAVAAGKGRQAFDVRDMEEMGKKTKAELDKSAKAAQAFGRQASLITNDVARNITDLIFQGGKFKDVMVDALESVAKALVRLALEKTLTSIAGKIGGLLKDIPLLGKALGGLFGGAASGAVGSAAGSAAGSVAGNAAGSAAGSAIGGVASAAGGAASAGAAAGQAAGAAASSALSATLGAVFAGVSAVSGVIGNFQMAGMNKSLDLIEKETRYSQIHLLNILEKLNQYLPMVNSIHDRLATIVTQGIGVYNAPGDGGLRLAPESIQIVVNGAGDPKAVAQMVVKELRLAGA